MKNKFPFVFKTICILFMLFQIVIVGAISVMHNPHFSFDESNTLNIASRPYDEIVNILGKEENFPAYYLVLHFFIVNGVSDKIIILCQFIFWLVSISLFWLVVKRSIKDKYIQLVTLGIYVGSSLFWYYAFYVRMYIFVIILNELVLLLLLNLKKNDKLKQIVIVLLLTIQCLVHPGGFILLFLVGLACILKSDFRKFGIGIFMLGGLLGVSILVARPNILATYTNGVEYLTGETQGFLSFMNGLVSVNTNRFSWVFLVLLGVFGQEYVQGRKGTKNLFDTFIIICILFSILTALASEFGFIHLPGRHFIVFSLPVVLFMGRMLQGFNKKKKVFLVMAIFFVVGMQSLLFLGQTLAEQTNYAKLCNNLNSEANLPIVTEFHGYNVIATCLGRKPEKIFLVHKTGIYNISNLSTYQILEIQARQGGSFSPVFKVSFSNYLKDNPKQLEVLKRQMEDISPELGKRFLYIMGIKDSDAIFPEEMRIVSGYKFLEFKPPSVYVFGK